MHTFYKLDKRNKAKVLEGLTYKTLAFSNGSLDESRTFYDIPKFRHWLFVYIQGPPLIAVPGPSFSSRVFLTSPSVGGNVLCTGLPVTPVSKVDDRDIPSTGGHVSDRATVVAEAIVDDREIWG